MRSLEQAAEDVVSNLMAGLMEDREALRTEVRKVGGAGIWLRRKFAAGALLAGLPRDLDEQELLGQTRAYYEHGEQRALTCRRCTAAGGACQDELLCFSPGYQPVWDPVRQELTERRCTKWGEHLIRTSLSLAGVDARSVGKRLADVGSGDLKRVEEFVRDVAGGSDRWLLVRASMPVGKTIAVGVLRKLRTRKFRSSMWYANCETLVRACKDYFAEKQSDDPLQRLRSSHFAVLDMLNPGQPRWMAHALDELLYERWSGRLPTLIVTQAADRVDVIAGSFPLSEQALSNALLCEVPW